MSLFTKSHTTHGSYLKALYAEEAEVLIQLSPGECLLGPAEVFLQVCLHLPSAAGREEEREREKEGGAKGEGGGEGRGEDKL